MWVPQQQTRIRARTGLQVESLQQVTHNSKVTQGVRCDTRPLSCRWNQWSNCWMIARECKRLRGWLRRWMDRVVAWATSGFAMLFWSLRELSYRSLLTLGTCAGQWIGWILLGFDFSKFDWYIYIYLVYLGTFAQTYLYATNFDLFSATVGLLSALFPGHGCSTWTTSQFPFLQPIGHEQRMFPSSLQIYDWWKLHMRGIAAHWISVSDFTRPLQSFTWTWRQFSYRQESCIDTVVENIRICKIWSGRIFVTCYRRLKGTCPTFVCGPEMQDSMRKWFQCFKIVSSLT